MYNVLVTRNPQLVIYKKYTVPFISPNSNKSPEDYHRIVFRIIKNSFVPKLVSINYFCLQLISINFILEVL